MILHKIGVDLNFGRDRSKIISLGSVFDLFNQGKYLVSVSPGIRIVRGMNGGQIIEVRRGAGSKPYLYDWIQRKEVSLANQDIGNDKIDIKKYIVEELSSNERLVSSGGEKIHISGDVGRFFFFVKNYLFFKKEKEWDENEVHCFDFFSGDLLWKKMIEGNEDPFEVDGLLVFWRAYHNKKITKTLTFDLITGNIVAQREIDGVALVGTVSQDVLYGSVWIDGNWSVFKYKPAADDLDCSPCPNPQLRKITGIEFVGEQYYIYYNNVSSESMSDGENQVYIDRYSLDGVPEGGVSVRGVEVKVPINRIGEKYFARAVSRGNVYTQREYILSWSEQDFLNETSENHIEKLNSICKKNIGSGNKNNYTISMMEECENFFQLFRQMSRGIYDLIMTTAREYDHESCKFDKNFDGTVYCDVANHKLDKRERVSIENMCQHLESEFADYASFDREMWPIPIKIIPIFSE